MTETGATNFYLWPVLAIVMAVAAVVVAILLVRTKRDLARLRKDRRDNIEAEEERDRLFNLSIDLLAVSGFDRFLQQVNPAWVRVLGWSRDDLMSRPIPEFVHPEDREATVAALDELLAGQPLDGLENRFRCLDGSYRWLSWSSFPYPDRRSVFSVVRDITQQKVAETKLLEYQERLRALSNQLALVEDRERQELAVAIHDGLAQKLFAIRAQMSLLKYPEKLPDLAQVVQEGLDIVDGTMTDARNLSFELFPPVLYEVGLEAALAWLVRNFSDRSGIACTFDPPEDRETDLPQDVRSMAYQCVRELLANVRKHSGAEAVTVSVYLEPGYLEVRVVDDGRGFEVDSLETPVDLEGGVGGFGLFSIRERMRSVGGQLVVESEPGRGCQALLVFPDLGS